MYRALSFVLFSIVAVSPILDKAEAQLGSVKGQDPIVDIEDTPPPSGPELGCVAPATKEEIREVIEGVRLELRKLGDFGLKPLWDEIIKKWLEEIGAPELPGAFGLLCSSSKTLDELVRTLNGDDRAAAPTRGVIDKYFAPLPPDEMGPPVYLPDRLPKLKELIEGLEKKSSGKLKDALKRANDLIDRLTEHFTACGLTPEGEELLRELLEEFQRLVENLIKRPKEKLSNSGSQSLPSFCINTTAPEPVLM